MKTSSLLVITLFFAIQIFAQQTDTLKSTIQKNAEANGFSGNNELKVNILFPLTGLLEVNYEYLTTDSKGLGVSVFVGTDQYYTKYAYGVIPHWRLYYGRKKASVFLLRRIPG